jgi:hypothetical protein
MGVAALSVTVWKAIARPDANARSRKEVFTKGDEGHCSIVQLGVVEIGASKPDSAANQWISSNGLDIEIPAPGFVVVSREARSEVPLGLVEEGHNFVE